MHELILSLWRETGVTIFMTTHDLAEGFYLGTRLWVFDKVRIDPQDPNRYGAKITYDLPVGQSSPVLLNRINDTIKLAATSDTLAEEGKNSESR
jgi:NitT/TauT family transport system ATP-binding protein